jgi:hypothetical protein
MQLPKALESAWFQCFAFDLNVLCRYAAVPELRTFANLEVKVLMNKDSCQIGPKEWIRIAKVGLCPS